MTQPFSSDLPIMVKKLSSVSEVFSPLSLRHVQVSVVLVELCPADQAVEISLEKCITGDQ